VADVADAAQALHHHRHFPEGPALDEFLEAAEFHDVELRIGDVARVIQKDADLGVALDAGHRINNDAL